MHEEGAYKNAMAKRTNIPRTSDDPIGELIDSGRTYPQLAAEWGLTTDATVRKLRNFVYVPPAPLASKMAETFGWPTPGHVINVWYIKNCERKEQLARAS